MLPTRKTFFATAIGSLAFGSYVIYDSCSNCEDLTFGIGILVSGLVYLALGIFIIYGQKTRDAVFGFQACPSCKSKSIDVKIMLKSGPEEMNSLAVCPIFLCKLKLHFSALFLFLFFGFLPIAALMFFDSLLAMFVVLCISMPVSAWFHFKLTPLIPV